MKKIILFLALVMVLLSSASVLATDSYIAFIDVAGNTLRIADPKTTIIQ